MKFKIIIEKDIESGYYVAEAPELEGCFTQAKDQRTLMKRIREAILLCLEDENTVKREVDIKCIQIPIAT
jgi:predicted RNase H-like HicB family nuclease